MPAPQQEQPAPQPSAQDQQGNMSGAGPDQQGGDGKQIVDGMMAVRTMLGGMMPVMAGIKGMPPEAMKALQTAAQAYDQFLSLAGKAMGVQMPDAEDESSEGDQAEMASGSKGAIPADGMSGGNPNAKPMY